MAPSGQSFDELAKRLEALRRSIAVQQAALKHSREEAAVLREEIRAERRAHGLEDRAARLDLHPPSPSFEIARPRLIQPEPPEPPEPPASVAPPA